MGYGPREGRIQPLQLIRARKAGRSLFNIPREYPGPVADLHDIVKAHEEWRLREALNLQASENVMSDAARSLLSTDFAHRYTLPDDLVPSLAGLKNAYRGTKHTDAVEELAERHAREVFRSAFASLKPLSGHLAGFLLLQACCKRGDRILVISAAHGGYDGYMPGFLPEYLGLDVQFLPFDPRVWNVDPKAAADLIIETRPRLVLLGASFILFPYNLRWLRGACDDVGTILGYDASHVLGLIAGGEFQKPMLEGVDVLSASTHKSFPGPQGGLFLSNRKDVFDRAMGSFLWRIQDNAHWNRIAATAQVLREMKEFGPAYARQVVANSRVLASQLDKWGFPVKFASQGYSASHQIHVDVEALKEKWSLGPADFADRLEANNLIVDAVGRIGTAEITRMGATEEDMQAIAGLIVRASRGEDVRAEVAGARSRLRLSFAFPP
ncbi:MAG: serine hydroxymethyltransferase [Methanobacteriota archaeon]|nr:MAG: serine hydroxymethyltransferase [Euryarchaeota archaeon]